MGEVIELRAPRQDLWWRQMEAQLNAVTDMDPKYVSAGIAESRRRIAQISGFTIRDAEIAPECRSLLESVAKSHNEIVDQIMAHLIALAVEVEYWKSLAPSSIKPRRFPVLRGGKSDDDPEPPGAA